MDKHLPECKYVPLQCPNLCGVTFERDFMDDHMKMCRLEDVECEFSGVGCEDRFSREEQEDHTRKNSRKHLNLTASLAVETREQLQDQLAKYREREQNLTQKLGEQDQKLKEQNQKLKEQEQKMEEEKDSLTLRLQELELKFKALLKGLSDETEAKLNTLMTRRFKMENFSKEKKKGRDVSSVWFGPAMFTHVGGYKFVIVVSANGISAGRGKAMAVQVFSLPGEFDGQLKWPVKAKFTIELVNQGGNNNVIGEGCSSWNKPNSKIFIVNFHRLTIGGISHFIEHSQLGDFLVNDTLHFLISNIEFC